MNRISPELRQLSARLIEVEALAQSTDVGRETLFSACEKLRPHLAMLLGKTGFGALLARALSLSQAEADWLRQIKVNADGLLEIPGESFPPRSGDTAAGEILLIAQLVALLIAFIGEKLTLQMLQETWPGIAMADALGKK